VAVTTRRWLNRNVLAIGVSSLMADANYEMVLAVLPLFLILGLGAPVYALGLVEGVADGSSAVFKFASGYFSDRIRHRKSVATAGYAVTAAGLGLLQAVTTWPQVLLGRGVAWIGRGARQPIRAAMLAGSVEKQDLGKAFGFHQAMDTVGAVIGPAVAGFIVLAFGPGWGFLINALTFVPLLVFLALVRVKALSARSTTPIGAALRDGLRFVRGRPFIAALIGVEMLGVIFLGHTFNSFLVLFAYDVLHVDALGYSFLLVGSGIGAVAAALYLAYARDRRHTGRFIVAAAMAEMAAILVFAFSTNYALSFLLLIVVGGAAVLTQSLTNTKIQLSAPDNLRGRVMGAYTFGTQGMRVLNGPLLGGAAILFGAPIAVAGAAAVVFAGLAAILARVPQLKQDR